jgi:predicted nucleic acid-binding protein
MIILDTNVVSEPLKPHPDPAVAAWFDRQAPETLFFTTTGLAELLVGLERLPSGRRKARLAEAIGELRTRIFSGRILAFDEAAALAYAPAAGRARSAGISLSVPDGQIAAIAISRHFAVATRDHAPFDAAGVQVIDPFRER